MGNLRYAKTFVNAAHTKKLIDFSWFFVPETNFGQKNLPSQTSYFSTIRTPQTIEIPTTKELTSQESRLSDKNPYFVLRFYAFMRSLLPLQLRGLR